MRRRLEVVPARSHKPKTRVRLPPPLPTFAVVVQAGRTPRCQRGGCGFDPRRLHQIRSQVAQLVEPLAVNQVRVGSNPTLGARHTCGWCNCATRRAPTPEAVGSNPTPHAIFRGLLEGHQLRLWEPTMGVRFPPPGPFCGGRSSMGKSVGLWPRRREFDSPRSPQDCHVV